VSVLIDSDVLIEVSRARDAGLLARWREAGASDRQILYSPVSLAELWAGVRPREQAALEALFQGLTCAPICEETGRMAGHFLRQYGKSHALGMSDALIAAAAAVNAAALWTRNRKHYPMKEIGFY